MDGMQEVRAGLSQERELAIYSTMLDLNKEIAFEWDLKADRITCSPKWEERFGYPFGMSGSAKFASASVYIHPDDIEILKRASEQVHQGVKRDSVVVRVLDSSGHYLWNRIRATVQKDENGVPTTVVGLMIDIDSDQQTSRALRAKAEQDSLTGLLNKDTTRTRVEDYLASMSEEQHAALLIIDLDNFKAVNDTYGHMFGDAVLNRAATMIRSQFRETDIIGRIGGEEFLVLMKDIPDRELVARRCEKLIQLMSQLYDRQLQDIHFSCSVGIALVPENGNDYRDLFMRADQALYHAKGLGKRTYQFFDSSKAVARFESKVNPHIRTRGGLTAFWGTAAVYMLEQMYETQCFSATFQSVLNLMGNQLQAEHLFFVSFEREDTVLEWNTTYLQPDAEQPDFTCTPDDMARLFGEDEVFCCHDMEQLDELEREIVQKHHAASLLLCPIKTRDELRGYVGMRSCGQVRLWTQEEIDTLTLLAHLASLFLWKPWEFSY